MGEDLVTSSELKSENPREVFQSKLLTLLVSMNEDSSLLGEISNCFAISQEAKEAVSQIHLFWGKPL